MKGRDGIDDDEKRVRRGRDAGLASYNIEAQCERHFTGHPTSVKNQDYPRSMSISIFVQV